MKTQWNATPWPNGLGYNVTGPNRTYEVWPTGSIVKLRRDDSLTGYMNMAYCETGERPLTEQHAINMVKTALTQGQWKPCYDCLANKEEE